MQTKTLYQIDEHKKIRIWSIEVVDNNDGTATINKLSGIKDGNLIPAVEYVNSGLNLGKSNETTAYEQAVLNAESDYRKKIKKGYVENIGDVRDKTTLGTGAPSPMLAEKYDPKCRQKKSRNLDHAKLKLRGKKLGISRKLDGLRCMSKVNIHDVNMFMRGGDEFPPLQHIKEQLLTVFNNIYSYVNEKYGVEEYILDGELYIDPKIISFNALNGLLKKQKKTSEDLAILKQVEYHIFDVCLPVGYSTRMKVFEYFKSTHLKPIETFIIDGDDLVIEKLQLQFLAEGYEGAMIRQLDIPYELGKRSWQIMKVKLFIDSEYKIVGFKQSTEGDTLGSIHFEIIEGLSDGKVGEKFWAAPIMSDKEVKEMWDNRDSHLGEIWTVEYFGISELGKPRFPKAKGLRADK